MFIPLKLRTPTPDEIASNQAMAEVRYIIEEWLLAEYACCYLPMQPNAVVETVSKSVPAAWAQLLGMSPAPSVAFTAMDAVEAMAKRLVSPAELDAACERAWRKARGLVD